jgi:hypothetical protein
LLSAGRPSFDGAANEDHSENGEDVGLDSPDQHLDTHERNRHDQTGKRKNDADDEGATHDIAEQAHDKRERARERLHDVQRDHEKAWLGKRLQIARKPTGADTEPDHREEDDRRECGVSFDARCRRLNARDERRPVSGQYEQEERSDQREIGAAGTPMVSRICASIVATTSSTAA